MKIFFLATFAFLSLLSLIAWGTKPRPIDPSRTQLTWTSDDNPFRRAQIEPFNRLHPDLHLELDPNNAEPEKVMVQSLAGVGPDVFDCYSGFYLSAFVKAGIAWDITDELKQRGIDIAAETWPAVHPHALYQGRAYGFPVNAAVNGLWYHKDLIAEAGVEIPTGPWKWEQAVPILQKLVKRNADGKIIRYGLVVDWEPTNCLQFVYQWGGRMYTPDGTRCVLDSPEAIAGIQFLQDLVHKHRVAPDPAQEAAITAAGGWGGGSVITLFGGQRAATALGGRWWLCRLRDFPNLRLGAAEAPHGAVRTFLGYGKATIINRNSPRRYEALKFLQYLHSEEYNRLINHQADGLGPVMKYAQGDDFLHDPAYPQEDFNHVWREMQSVAIPEQVSPFMNGAVVKQLMKAQMDQVKSKDKSAAQAMRDLARQVNEKIQENLRLSPDLREQYEKLSATPVPAGAEGGRR